MQNTWFSFSAIARKREELHTKKLILVYFRIVNSNLLFFRGRPSKVYQKQLLFIILLFGNHLWLAFVKTLKIQVWFTTKNLASMRYIISTCWKKNNNLVTTKTFGKFSTSLVGWKILLFKVNSWLQSCQLWKFYVIVRYTIRKTELATLLANFWEDIIGITELKSYNTMEQWVMNANT